MNPFLDALMQISVACFWSYTIGSMLLLLFFGFVPKHRELWLKLIRQSNFLLAVMSLVLIACNLASLAIAYVETLRTMHDANAIAFGTLSRATGPFAWMYWLVLLGPVAAQLFWIRRLRRSIPLTAVLLILAFLTAFLLSDPVWLLLLIYPLCLLPALRK